MRNKQNIFSFFNIKWINLVLLFTACSSSLSAEDGSLFDENKSLSKNESVSGEKLSLISVTISRNGNVSYINISPLHYEAKKKDLDPIKISPQDSQRDRPMELTIYSTCNRGSPQQESALGFRTQFLMVSFLLSPHPEDELAVYYLLPLGWFRMIKEGVRGYPYFQEEGIMKMEGVHNKIWEMSIKRSDVTAVNAKTDYSISFSKDSDQPLFIQALLSVAKPSSEGIPQVTLILESPSLYVRATYALIYKGARQYQPIQKMDIREWWRKQQKWCPGK